MKGSGETKLLLILGLIVLLGGGALVGLTVANGGSPTDTPTPPPVVTEWDAEKFKDLTKGATHIYDKPGAKVTVVEFADFQCPSCRRAYNDVLKKMKKEKPVRFIFRHLPLRQIHPNAEAAAVAVEAAAKQGKFWEMYDALFAESEPELSDAYIEEQAKKVGLNLEQFKKDIDDKALLDPVYADEQLARKYNVDSTPTFIVQDASGKYHQVVGGAKLQDLFKQLGL